MFNSEYKVKQVLLREDIYIEPKQVILDYQLGADNEPKTIEAFYISPSDVFRRVFCKGSLLHTALEYMQNRNDDYRDLKDGTKFCHLKRNTLPFILFFDELETGNPLGSHRTLNKVGAIYLSLRCFPPKFYSKLENIFVCAIFPSLFHDNIDPLLEKLIKDINDLQLHGLVLQSHQIYFKFAGITGDNLGLNQILGFTSGFSANHYCRLCKSHKSDMQTMLREDTSTLRTENNFVLDLNRADPSATGIKKLSVLNKIENYHVAENDILDPMHDLAEGVGNFGLSKILEYYLTEGILTMEIVNGNIKRFNFLQSNRPPPLKYSNILKGDLTLSASELIVLVMNFNLLFGFYVPTGCPIWEYYVSLREIFNIVLHKVINEDLINYLQVLIAEHNFQYQTLFSVRLKPKHHFLTHYPRSLRRCGPLSHLWAMRFEGKNLSLKHITQNSFSRVNLCKSVMVRLSFHLSKILYSLQRKVNTSDVSSVSCPLANGCYSWIVYNDVKYRVGDTICSLDQVYDNPKFCQIKQINVEETNATFSCLTYATLYFDPHMCSYVVQLTENSYSIIAQHVSQPLVTNWCNNRLFINNFGI